MWLSGCLDHFGSLLLGLPCNDGQNEHLIFFWNSPRKKKKTQTISKNYTKFAGGKNLARSIEKLEKKKTGKEKKQNIKMGLVKERYLSSSSTLCAGNDATRQPCPLKHCRIQL